MDADVAAFQRFVDTALVIEAPAYAGKASQAVQAVARARATVSFESRGRGLSSDRYRELVAEVRRQVTEDLRPGPDYRVEIFDRSRKDLGAEARRIDTSLWDFGQHVKAAARDGAMAQGVVIGAKPACIVVGFPNHTDVNAYYSQSVGFPVNTGSLDNETAHRMFFWHEVGHCILGPSEAYADTFAALMMVRHTSTKDALAVVATWREVSELTTPDVDDDHFMSASLWRVVERSSALRSDPTFMSMDMKGVAALAKSMADTFALTEADQAEIVAFRKAVSAAAGAKAHYVRTEEGLQRVGFGDWLRSHSRVPEFARLIRSIDSLMGGVVSQSPYKPRSSSEFRKDLSEIAGRGDPTAKLMLRGLDRKSGPAERHEASMGIKIPYEFGTDAYHGQVIDFDPKCQTILFSPDNDRYAIRDGRAVIDHGDLSSLADRMRSTEVADLGLRR